LVAHQAPGFDAKRRPHAFVIAVTGKVGKKAAGGDEPLAAQGVD
jgi:hypothetical protein